ncbi:MAG: nuclear transport factor 2 family protein [Ferruginibacter sp.]
MKFHNFKTTFLFVLLLCCITKESVSQKVNSGNDTETLKKMEYDWLMAEFRLDTATIAAMIDETFIAVGATGSSGKQEELKGIYETMSQRLKNEHVVDSLYLDDMRIQIYDNTAVVTFFSVTKGSIKGVPFENRRTRMYDVWVKRNGQWKAVSSQVTPIH